MTDVYFLTVTLHVLAALVWLGGMFFFAIAAPVLRRVEDEGVRAELFSSLGRRFRVVGWICVGLLLVTGLAQLRLRGWWGAAFWGRAGFWGTALGTALAWKLGLVVLMISVQAVHDFWAGPRASLATLGTREARSLRAFATKLARFNVLVGLVLVYFAVRLGRGGLL